MLLKIKTMPLSSKTFLQVLKPPELTKDWFCFICPKVITQAKFTGIAVLQSMLSLSFLILSLKDLPVLFN